MEQSTIEWFKRESLKLADTWPVGSPMETETIAAWRAMRPKMVAELEAAGALEAAAHVLVDRALNAKDDALRAGMPPTDAMEQAEKDWLLMEPEDDSDPGVSSREEMIPSAGRSRMTADEALDALAAMFNPLAEKQRG